MENLKQIKQLLTQLIASADSKLIELQNIKTGIANLLTLDVTSLEKNDEGLAITKSTKAINIAITQEINNEYPIKCNNNKLRYILNKYNRVMSFTDFENAIRQFEKETPEILLSKLDRTLRGLTNPEKGEWTYFNFRGSKLKFYTKPEWRTEDKKYIRPEFFPDTSQIEGFSQEYFGPNYIKWHRDC